MSQAMSMNELSNVSLRSYLIEQNCSEYIVVVPLHWLDQAAPLPGIQLATAILLLVICVLGNVSQILVFAAYYR